MLLTVAPLEPRHLEAAAALSCRRYRSLRAGIPALPPRYGEIDVLLPMLHRIAEAGPTAAAFRGTDLVGFMAAWQTPSFRGRPTTFSPEYANGADLEDSPRIYEALYTYLAEVWIAGGYTTHCIGALPNDSAGLEGWHWLGFGMVAADGVRDLSPVDAPRGDTEIRKAVAEDLDALVGLETALTQHLVSSPTFLRGSEPSTREALAAEIADPKKVFWLARVEGRPLAYLLTGPASDDASALIYDEGTMSITGAYTQPDARGKGTATALLDRGLTWAREQGYVRCAVDFEPMNPLARRFWMRYFAPVSYSLIRTINSETGIAGAA